MPLTVKLDPEQLTRLTDAVNELSTNLAKWQAHQSIVIKQGLSDLVMVLGGTDTEAIQERINELRSQLASEADALEDVRDSQSSNP